MGILLVWVLGGVLVNSVAVYNSLLWVLTADWCYCIPLLFGLFGLLFVVAVVWLV